MMGRSSFRSVLLLISVLLLVSSSHGLGRKVLMKTSEKEEESVVLSEEIAGKSRELDYEDPKFGFLRPPPPVTHADVVASPFVPPGC